ncbi:hypothetical protein [Micromonospora sp. NPDC051296]|uniref:hypothetical protein n=1 Tax=Micromonospora sp. NPDC051296 TaxID=3155046 RepID=UPI003431975E
MSSPPNQMPGSVVIEMSDDQWREATDRALDRLHLTYRQLAEMAKNRDFSSVEAQKLWMSIGNTRA